MDKNSFSALLVNSGIFCWWSPFSYLVWRWDVVLGLFLRHPDVMQGLMNLSTNDNNASDHCGFAQIFVSCFQNAILKDSFRLWFSLFSFCFPHPIPLCAGSRAGRLQQSPTWAKKKEASAKSRWAKQRHSEGDGSKVRQTPLMKNEMSSLIEQKQIKGKKVQIRTRFYVCFMCCSKERATSLHMTKNAQELQGSPQLRCWNQLFNFGWWRSELGQNVAFWVFHSPTPV